MWSKRCQQCGQPNRRASKFCRLCGTPFAVPRWRMPRWGWGVAALVVIVAVGAGIWWQRTPKTATQPKSVALPSLIKSLLPSVVLIRVTTPSGTDLGSGFLYDHHGDIATNAHVVANATRITVITAKGNRYSGRLIGLSHAPDLAAIRVTALQSLAPLTLSQQGAPPIGSSVVALGSPYGLQDTVTTGMISGSSRNFTIHGVAYHNMLQISAPIAPGSSGGPLINPNTGTVVGMNTAVLNVGGGNVGFAIPTGQLRSLLQRWAAQPARSHTSSAKASSAPPASATPSPSVTSVAAAAQSALFAFYTDINAQDYQAAYAFLGRTWQSQEPYAQFVSGYRSTVNDRLLNIRVRATGSATAVADFTLIAENHSATGAPVYTTYAMHYVFQREYGRMRITHGTARVVKKSSQP